MQHEVNAQEYDVESLDQDASIAIKINKAESGYKATTVITTHKAKSSKSVGVSNAAKLESVKAKKVDTDFKALPVVTTFKAKKKDYDLEV
jgi:cell fate (sporulation/competence/biofilm development) regulator YmcA (YheA/YmcA/DUF963 family)